MSRDKSREKSKQPSTLKIDGGKFEANYRDKLGAGCFGEVFKGTKTVTKESVAIKFEPLDGTQLEFEYSTLCELSKPWTPQGFAECYYFGVEGNQRCLVMECLASSLEERVQACGGKFTVKTTVLLAQQILQRIEYLHSRGIVHRDIKSENFMVGLKAKCHHVYLIDFGLCKPYWTAQGHSKKRTNLNLTGTARYASINAHRGIEQTRRDDLEAIGHMLLYFLRGSLPWSGLDAKNKAEKYRKIMEKKIEFPLATLCEGFPDEFRTYLSTTRELQFEDKPDYNWLRGLFDIVRKSKEWVGSEPVEDWGFEWNDGKDFGRIPLEPLVLNTGLKQPDERSKPKKGGGFCLCGRSATKDD